MRGSGVRGSGVRVRNERCPPLYGGDLTSSPPHGGISSFGATVQDPEMMGMEI